MKLRIGILRLMLAVIGFAVPLAMFSANGTTAIAVALIVGLALAALALIAETQQIWPMIRTGIIAAAGTMIGLLCCPMVDPPYNRGDEFGYMIMGCLFGCLAGISWIEYRNTPINIKAESNSSQMDAKSRT